MKELSRVGKTRSLSCLGGGGYQEYESIKVYLTGERSVDKRACYMRTQT